MFVIQNSNGLQATISNYGLILVSLLVPDKNEQLEDIVLGFNNLESYQQPEGAYFGTIIGPYANRIENGSFELDGKSYKLEVNSGSNHLHGGSGAYNAIVWDIKEVQTNKIIFEKHFKDGYNGYPGNIHVVVTYTLKENNSFAIEYKATTDQPTLLNMTNHSFFNLKGEGNGTIEDHKLWINAAKFTPVNAQLIPNKGIKTVSGTVFDFTASKTIGKDIDKEEQQLLFGNGYDHNFVLNQASKNKDGLVEAAVVKEPKSGRQMTVFTDKPGMQLYTGNFISNKLKGKRGKSYQERSGFCLETQHFPNAPNTPEFPSAVVRPENPYKSNTQYQFSIFHQDQEN